MPGVFDVLTDLENAIRSALNKLPSPQRGAYEKWVQKELTRLRREIAKYPGPRKPSSA